MGGIARERVPVEGHDLIGSGQVCDDAFVEVGRVEIAPAGKEAANAAEMRVAHQIDERRLGAAGVARYVVDRVAGAGGYAVDVAEVDPAFQKRHHGAGGMAGAHAAAFE